MELIPAIDLLDGKCVRLRQGDYQQVTYYQQSPRAFAESYSRAGADWLHVVDLAASRDGARANTAPMFELISSVSQKVQTGGGVRGPADIKDRLASGAARVVVGSVAAESPQIFCQWLEQFGPDSLVAALDVRFDDNGVPRVRSRGWTEDAGSDLWNLLDQYSATGFRHLLCTDIGRDGLMEGPNADLYKEIHKRYPHIEVQASGGVRNIADLRALAKAGASAAISGKALLDGEYEIRDALVALGADR